MPCHSYALRRLFQPIFDALRGMRWYRTWDSPWTKSDCRLLAWELKKKVKAQNQANSTNCGVRNTSLLGHFTASALGLQSLCDFHMLKFNLTLLLARFDQFCSDLLDVIVVLKQQINLQFWFKNKPAKNPVFHARLLLLGVASSRRPESVREGHLVRASISKRKH